MSRPGLTLKEECEARFKREKEERETKRKIRPRPSRSSSSSSSSSPAPSSVGGGVSKKRDQSPLRKRDGSESKRTRSTSHRSREGKKHRRGRSSSRSSSSSSRGGKRARGGSRGARSSSRRRRRRKSRGSRDRSRSRVGSESRRRLPRPPQGNPVRSTDPKLVASRVFVGNLPTEQMERGEIEAIFSKHGRLLGVMLMKGYGFVQFEDREEAVKAVAAESGCRVRGYKIDVKLAAEGKLEKGNGSESYMRYDSHDRPLYGNDFSPGLPPFMRGGPGPPFSHRGPFLPPPPPYARGGPLDEFGRPIPLPPPPHGEFRRPPFPPGGPGYMERGMSEEYRGPPRWPRRYTPSPPPAGPPPRPPIDCEIIIGDAKQRLYGEGVLKPLATAGLAAVLSVLGPGVEPAGALEDATRRRLPLAVVVNEQNELHRSITVNILHGQPQEHRNMPIDDAIALVIRSFSEYEAELKKAPPPSGVKGHRTDFVPPNRQALYLLNLLADNRFLLVDELETVIAYLEERRDQLVEAEGGVPLRKKAAAVERDTQSTADQESIITRNVLELLRNEKAALAREAPAQEPPLRNPDAPLFPIIPRDPVDTGNRGSGINSYTSAAAARGAQCDDGPVGLQRFSSPPRLREPAYPQGPRDPIHASQSSMSSSSQAPSRDIESYSSSQSVYTPAHIGGPASLPVSQYNAPPNSVYSRAAAMPGSTRISLIGAARAPAPAGAPSVRSPLGDGAARGPLSGAPSGGLYAQSRFPDYSHALGSAPGVRGPPSDEDRAPDVSFNSRASVLGPRGSVTSSPHAASGALQHGGEMSIANILAASKSINFDSPSVQQALDNLISSGPNLLKNISDNMRASSFSSSAPPGAWGRGRPLGDDRIPSGGQQFGPNTTNPGQGRGSWGNGLGGK